MAPRSPSARRKAAGVAAAAAGCLALVVAAMSVDAWDLEKALAGALSFAAGHPGWTILIVIALMIAHNVAPIPAEAIAIGAGAMLGPALGLMAVWCGAMLGACLAFWMSRVWGRDLVLRLLPSAYVARLDKVATRCTWPALLGLRLIPVVSFNLVNYAAGLTQVSWPMFLWTTGLGILPITAVSVGIGANIDMLAMKYAIGGGAVILVLLWIIRRSRR
jgi:uncharacterized membrane protein YdjX (TVP38/TMEM64 family)